MTEKSAGSGKRWTRMASEAAIIVASILLAFWVDAWWDERSDRNQERALLQALVRDFAGARDIFERTTEEHARTYRSMEQMLYWTEQGFVPDDRADEVDLHLGRVFWRGEYKPPMGAVDTILASGRLDLLDNPELVSELTRWKALVENLNGSEQAAIDHFYDVIYPFLSSRLNLQDLDKGIPYPGGVPWPQQATGAEQLFAEREFHNIIYVHWVLHWNIATELPAVDAAIDRVTLLAGQELEN